MKQTGLLLLIVVLCCARAWAAEDVDGGLPVEGVGPSTAEPAEGDQGVQPLTASELFELLGVSREVFGRFVDGRPTGDDQREPLAVVLYNLAKFPPTKVYHWARRDLTSQQLIDDPATHRGQLVQLGGRAKRVTVEPLPVALAERFEMSQIFRVRFDLPDGGRAIVYARSVPAAWKVDEPIDEPASFEGVFLNVGLEGRGGRPAELYFAAYRVAWYPSSLLGSLGMDFGLLDHVQQSRPIGAAEAEAFYELLQAASRAKLSDLLAAAQGQQWTVIPQSSGEERLADELRSRKPPLRPLMISDAAAYVGQLMAFQGRLYRCIPIRITDPELAGRLGFDTYYELAIFIDLGYQQRLHAEGSEPATDAAARPKVVDTYPVFACVPRLPSGFPTGEKLNEGVRVPGFFFKLWSYPTSFAAPSGEQRREVSPLVIGPGVEWLTRPQPADTRLGMIAGAALVGLLAAVFVVLWLTRRRDEQFRREVLQRPFELPAETATDIPQIETTSQG